jgi:hypothetical protein
VGVDIDAGFDLILDLSGEKFSLAIDQLSASAGIELAVTDLTVAAQLGFLGLQAGGQGSGSGVRLEAEATLALDRTPNQAGGTRFEIAELLSSEALGSISVDLSGSASASLKGLSVSAGSASMPLDKDLELALYVPDLLDWRVVEVRNSPFDLAQSISNGSLPAGAVVVVLPDLGSLLDVRNISFGDIIDAVRFGLQVVDDLAADQPFYTAQLPVINASLSELMVLGDTWMGKLDAVLDDPVAGLDEAELAIEQALGLSEELLDLSIDNASGKLLLDLNLALAYADEFALNLDLQSLADLAGLSLPDGLGQFFDASGEGTVALALGADLQLRLGVTLPKQAGQLPKIGLENYDAQTDKGTRVTLKARMAAEDVNLNFKVGPLEMGVEGGSLVLDADGKDNDAVATADALADAASLSLTWIEGKPVIQTIGAFDLGLPLSAKIFGKDIKIGQLQVSTNPTLGAGGICSLGQ